MKVYILKDKFFDRHTGNKEVHPKPSRPFGVFIKEINGVKWAIPLVTNRERHRYIYRTVKDPTTGKKKGVDLSKATVIRDSDIKGLFDKSNNSVFQKEKMYLDENEDKIKKRFIKLIARYESNSFSHRDKQYTALQYFPKDVRQTIKPEDIEVYKVEKAYRDLTEDIQNKTSINKKERVLAIFQSYKKLNHEQKKQLSPDFPKAFEKKSMEHPKRESGQTL